MICGTGVDIISIERFGRGLDRFAERFLKKIFTPGELDYCLRKMHPVPSLAARFAAKEACYKAFTQALGQRPPVTWKDIEVEILPNGSPRINIRKHFPEINKYLIHLSLSHSRDDAIAWVIVESK